jgi:hypothetical protein
LHRNHLGFLQNAQHLNTILAYDIMATAAKEAAEDEDFQAWNLSLPATFSNQDNTTIGPHEVIHTSWTRTNPVPPEPCFCKATWNPFTMPEDKAEPEDFSSSQGTYKPRSIPEVLRMRPKGTPEETNASFEMLPGFIGLPPAAKVTPGAVFNLKEVSYSNSLI